MASAAMQAIKRGTAPAALNLEDLQGAWWGPMDGPRPESADASVRTVEEDYPCSRAAATTPNRQASRAASPPAPTTSVGADAEVAALRRRVENVQAAVLARDDELAALSTAESAASGEVAALRNNVQLALARRLALEEEVRERAEDIHRSEEAVRRAELRISELESKTSGRSLGAGGASLSGGHGFADDPLHEDPVSGKPLWRECVSQLEAELRRRSSRTLEAHRRVHRLEVQLREQLEVNDNQVDAVHAALRSIWAAVQDLPDAHGGRAASCDGAVARRGGEAGASAPETAWPVPVLASSPAHAGGAGGTSGANFYEF